MRRSHKKRPQVVQLSEIFRSPAADERDVAVHATGEEELLLKLAHADSLQSWADCKFLQCIESNLESLPQLTIQTYVFITGQLDYDYPWINCECPIYAHLFEPFSKRNIHWINCVSSSVNSFCLLIKDMKLV